jgi:hypothetical protein
VLCGILFAPVIREALSNKGNIYGRFSVFKDYTGSVLTGKKLNFCVKGDKIRNRFEYISKIIIFKPSKNQ